MEINIEQQVYLEPKYLNLNLDTHILEKLQTCIIGTCDYENGYILGVNKILKIGDNKLSQTSSCIFTVSYLATVLKPEIGRQFIGKVCMVFNDGLFIEVYNKMKVLVPYTTFDTFTFEHDKFKKDNLTIGEGSEVNIEITMIKYEKKNFNCIGKLIF
jgi:DNA-directed RNA polymerase subunit E'/Rpb7